MRPLNSPLSIACVHHTHPSTLSPSPQSDMLEDVALSLLDAIADPTRAMPLIAMVPSLGKGDAAQPLWTRSVLDLAADDDNLTACKRLVAHRHSQHLLEAFFAGDFPYSQARIPADSSLMMIAVQARRRPH